MNLALPLAAFVAAWTCAYAQPPRPADQARALLQSESIRERAWGAWYAGISHDTTLDAVLTDHLRAAQPFARSPRDGEEYAYVQALFDALIQLGAAVPTSVMLPFEDSWRSEILILMNGPRGNDAFSYGRNIDADGAAALLEMRGHQIREDEWAAINDLLFAIDRKVAIQKVLEELRVTSEFCVTDQPTIRADDGSGGATTSKRRFPKGLPPIALYQIRLLPASPGNVLFSQNPIPVYYARVVVPTDGEAGWFYFEFHGASTSTRQRTLERLLSEYDNSHGAEIFHPWAAEDWRGTEKTADEIDRLLDDQAAAIRRVLQNIERSHLIKLSGMHVPIAVVVRDCRKDGQSALPQIAPVREVIFP